jgi:hypothetical protein
LNNQGQCLAGSVLNAIDSAEKFWSILKSPQLFTQSFFALICQLHFCPAM